MDNDKKKKKSALKERDKQIIIVLVLALALVFSYRFATGTMTEKIEAADKTIKEKKEERDILVDANNRREDIEKETRELEEANEKILKQYPEKTSMEKVIEKLVMLFEKYTFGISSLRYEPTGTFFNFVNAEGADDATSGSINGTSLTFEFNTTYSVLRKLITYINNESETRLKIDSLEASVNETSGGLTGTIRISVFTGYNITKYEEPDFGVDIEKDSIFAEE